MSRITRSRSAAARRPNDKEPKDKDVQTPSSSRKRASEAAKETRPVKRRQAAVTPKETEETEETEPRRKSKTTQGTNGMPRDSNSTGKNASSTKKRASGVAAAAEDSPAPKKQKPSSSKKAAVPPKTEAELKALRDGPVPERNPEVAPRSPPDEVYYWCMKSEPELRLEDGYEIKFSVDDLAVKEKPEGWDGIRSYMARNNLRQMRKGDKALFYHSNCKEPGAVGIMTIVNEYSPDWNACINDNPYYDASAPHDGSKWSLVHVRIEHKLPQIVPLRLLKEEQDKGPLKDMMLLKQSRLSVSRVTESEWEEVMRLARGLVGEKEWERSVEGSKKFRNYAGGGEVTNRT